MLAWVGIDGCVNLRSRRSRELTVTYNASGAWHSACVLASAEAPTFPPDFSGCGDSKSNTWIKVIFGSGRNLEKPLISFLEAPRLCIGLYYHDRLIEPFSK